MYHVDAIWRTICINMTVVIVVVVGAAATADAIVVIANAIVVTIVISSAINGCAIWGIGGIGYAIRIKSMKEIAAETLFFFNMLIRW